MKTYTAYFYTDANYARQELQADTPEQALAAARALDADNDTGLYFTNYDDDQPVNQIDILDEDGNEVAFWYDDDLRLRLAAPKLLEALQYCDMTLADLEASKRKGYIAHAKELARAAIAKVKGE
jgi:hypothetical protein